MAENNRVIDHKQSDGVKWRAKMGDLSDNMFAADY